MKKRKRKLTLAALLLCLIAVVCIMFSACDVKEIVDVDSEELAVIENDSIFVYPEPVVSYINARPLKIAISKQSKDTDVLCYVSSNPLSGAKEEVQLYSGQMPTYLTVDQFSFHSDVAGAHCVTMKVSDDAVKIEWLPFIGSANGWEKIDEDRYFEAVIKEGNNIVGYVLCRYQYVADGGWKLHTLLSRVFPEVNGKYQKVTENYLQQLAESAV